MPIALSYASLAKKLAQARGWASGVTNGNRCALVVGAALGVRPAKALGETTFNDLPDSHRLIPRAPFLDWYYVKAEHLKNGIEARFGKPDIHAPGKVAFPRMAGRRGVAYLEDCWVTNKDDVNYKLGLIGWGMSDDPGGTLPMPERTATGDHIDLFDGTFTEIYRGTGGAADRVYGENLIRAAAMVWFWETRP